MSDATFDEKLDTIVRVLAVNLIALLYAVVLFRWLGLSSSGYKLAIYGATLTVLPFLSAAALLRTGRFEKGAAEFVDLVTSSAVVLCALMLAAISIDVWHYATPSATPASIIRVGLIAIAGLHAGLTAVGLSLPAGMRKRIATAMRFVLTLGGTVSRAAIFLFVVSAAMVLAFYVGTGNPFLNVAFGFIQGLTPRPGWVGLFLTAMLAAGSVSVCFQLLSAERDFQTRGSYPFFGRPSVALALSLAAIVYFYFDYKFDTDVLHFLTNVGPASQIVLADTVPMVTAFSQYGPGPMMITWATFLVTPPSFHAANILSQFHSLAFYCVIIICMVRMTSHRLAALWLGFFAVGVLLAGWWGGNLSLNSVPSSMGFRYLPNGLVVLAVSFLPAGRRQSWATFLAMTLSALWSFETLAGSVAVYGLFLLVACWRERAIAGFFTVALTGIAAPVALAVALTSCVTLLWAGAWPNYLAYLQFARVYNMTSEFWALDASGAFLGWIPVAAVLMCVLTLGWFFAFDAANNSSPVNWETLVKRYVPMAALAGFMSSYFAGRSVDFTLIICFLPLCAIVIPPALSLLDRSISGERVSKQLAVIPVAIIFVALWFSFNALYRKGGPYATAISECVNYRRCTPFGLAKIFAQRYPQRPMLDEAYDNSGLTHEAVALIERYAPQSKQIALFLGVQPRSVWSLHTNAVLVLTGKGHRWPISYVLSDEINPIVRQSILDADVRLQDGELVFIRSDESQLGPLESAIVAKIRSDARLCVLAPSGGSVTVYRVERSQPCGSGS
ncbi:MAG: hypothetical protein HY242_05570 [Afipia sp.]|nr:hypothetical protein [Afipia sp.]